MDYGFNQRERSLGKIVFALTLDRKKMTERIVIGESSEVRRRLERGAGDVYFDETRSLGALLLSFERDPDRHWNANAMTLHASYEKFFSGNARWKAAKPGADFLRDKYELREPTAMFAAIRTWEDYLNCFNQNHGPLLFIDRCAQLYRPFVLYGQYRPWQEEATEVLTKALHEGESQVELWYPVKKRPCECVIATSSSLPLIFYYLHKIEEWSFVFQECKICGEHFLARSRHFELCSDVCRKAQATRTKREFDERAKGDRLGQLYDSAYYYWYNRIRKLKRAKDMSAEKLAIVDTEFISFRAEALRQKAEVKRGKRSLSQFSSWLVEQQSVIDDLIE